MSADWPWLSMCIIWPLLGILGLIFVHKPRWIKTWALLVTGLEFLWCLAILLGFDAQLPGWQFHEHYAWIRSFNIKILLAVDSLSVWLLLANAWLMFLVMIYNVSAPDQQMRSYFSWMLLFEALSMGILLADDLMLFFFCWELSLIPILFLIAQWGIGAHRRLAATQYVLMMLFGGGLLLIGIGVLEMQYFAEHPGEFNFSLQALADLPLTESEQYGVMVLWLLAFAIKAPLPPFHNWLPLVAINAPPALTALLLGMKLGLFAMLRILIPLVPQALRHFQDVLAVWAVVSALYTGLVAIRQTNLRALLAYSSISHVALVFMALMAFNQQAWQGVSLQMLNFALVSATLMLMAGMLERRFASNELCHLGGLASPMPRFTLAFFILIFASLGLPGSSGFVAEFLLMLGIAKTFPVMLGIILLASLIAASYSLNFLKKAFWGPVRDQSIQVVDDLQLHELVLLIVVLIVVVFLGFFPNFVTSFQMAGQEVQLQTILVHQ